MVGLSCGDQLSCEVGNGSGAPWLLIGTWRGVGTLMVWPTGCVCATLGARSVHMRVASSSVNVGLCMYVYMFACVCLWVCEYVLKCMVSQFQSPRTILNISHG